MFNVRSVALVLCMIFLSLPLTTACGAIQLLGDRSVLLPMDSKAWLDEDAYYAMVNAKLELMNGESFRMMAFTKLPDEGLIEAYRFEVQPPDGVHVWGRIGDGPGESICIEEPESDAPAYHKLDRKWTEGRSGGCMIYALAISPLEYVADLNRTIGALAIGTHKIDMPRGPILADGYWVWRIFHNELYDRPPVPITIWVSQETGRLIRADYGDSVFKRYEYGVPIQIEVPDEVDVRS